MTNAVKISWSKKKKRPASSLTAFSVADDDQEENEVDWLGHIPVKRSCLPLEDQEIRFKRVKNEGIILAEAERYSEAMRKFDDALQCGLESENHVIYDMKAQVLLELMDYFTAVVTAEKCVSLAPRWWSGYQTLGRALINLGELRKALINFQKAIHLQPDEQELWDGDLKPSVELKTKSDEFLANGGNCDFMLRECMRIRLKYNSADLNKPS